MKRFILAALLALVVPGATPQTESLLIGPADLLHIQVFDTPELEQHVRVTDSGQISVILGGPVSMKGITPREAAAVIEAALIQRGFLLHPHVTVTVEQYVTQNVTVLGQVRSPGTYTIGTPRSILDVIAMAGGLTEVADRHLTLQHAGAQESLSYFLPNAPEGSLSNTPTVQPGDKVIVPKAPVVYVLGSVGRPGGYAWSTNDSRLSVLQAISLAGGVPPTAAVAHARLMRAMPDHSRKEIPLHLGDMQKGKKPDVELEGDDILYVPFSHMRNVAVGAGSLISAASTAAIYRF